MQLGQVYKFKLDCFATGEKDKTTTLTFPLGVLPLKRGSLAS